MQALKFCRCNSLPTKGGTHGSKGSKDHLLVDKFRMSEARRRHKNLFMAWLDVKKTFDSVPHDWILYCLKLFGVHTKIIRFLDCAICQWCTELTVNEVPLGQVDINCIRETVSHHCYLF